VKDRFTDQLQSIFDAKDPNAIEVMNVAKPGWNTGDEIQPPLGKIMSVMMGVATNATTRSSK
jgi:hypothetical protein